MKKVRFDGKTMLQHGRAAQRTASRAGLDPTDATDVRNALLDWLNWSGWTVCGGTHSTPDQARIDTFVAREIDERRTNENLR